MNYQIIGNRELQPSKSLCEKENKLYFQKKKKEKK